MTGPSTLRFDSPDPQEWADFVASMSGDVLTQSELWAQLKAPGYSAHVRAARNADGIVGGVQLLCRRVGPITVGYAANGPLVATAEPDLIDAVVNDLCAFGDELGVTALIVQPASISAAMDAALAAKGFTIAPVNVSTPATVEVDLGPEPDVLLAALRSSRRRNIRKAEKAGVVVRRGTAEDVAIFHQLHMITAARQEFDPMSLSYLERQWSVLGGAGVFDIYLAELDGSALAAATVTHFGERSVFKLAGTSDDPGATKVRPSDALHWEIIKDARARGSRIYDFGGFDRDVAEAMDRGEDPSEEFRSGASQFKLGFGGTPMVLPESVWRLSPALLRPAQRPATWAFHRATFLRRALARLRSAE